MTFLRSLWTLFFFCGAAGLTLAGALTGREPFSILGLFCAGSALLYVLVSGGTLTECLIYVLVLLLLSSVRHRKVPKK